MASAVPTDAIQLLIAVDQAAWETADGWVTPTQIRSVIDDAAPSGYWARGLWRLKDEGLLETRRDGAQTLWGITERGGKLLLSVDRTDA